MEPDHRSRIGTVSRVARNTGLQAVGEVVSRLGAVAFYVVMARELGKRGFGDFTFALSLAFIVTLAGFGTDFTTVREVARDARHMHRLYWNSTAIKVTVGTLGLGLAVAIGLLGGYSTQVRIAIAILAAATLADVLARTSQAVFRGLEEMAPIPTSLILQRLWLAAIGVTALELGVGLIGVAAIYLSSSLVGLAYISVRLLRRGLRAKLEVSANEVRRLIGDSWPLALGAAFSTVLGRLDAVLLSFFKGNEAVGVYGASYKVFEVATLVTFVFGTAIYPVFSRLSTTTSPTIGTAHEAALKAVSLVLVPLSVALMLFPRPLVAVLYGPQLADAAGPLRLLGPSVWLWGIFSISMFALAAQGRQRAIAWILGVAGATVNTALNLALIPTHSYMGAAIAMTATMIVLAVSMTTMAVRVAAQAASLRRVLSGAVAGAIAMGAVALAVGTDVAGAAAALAAYCAVALGSERLLYPADLRLISTALRRRGEEPIAI